MRSSLFLIAVLACGCGSVRTVAPGTTPEPLRDRRVTVVLTDGTQHAAVGLRVDADSVSWFDAASGRIRTAPTVGVAEVRRRNTDRALLRGTLGGVLAGTAVGFLGWPQIRVFDEGRAHTTGVAAAQGAVVGLAVGALTNAGDRYVLARPDSLR